MRNTHTFTSPLAARLADIPAQARATLAESKGGEGWVCALIMVLLGCYMGWVARRLDGLIVRWEAGEDLSLPATPHPRAQRRRHAKRPQTGQDWLEQVLRLLPNTPQDSLDFPQSTAQRPVLRRPVRPRAARPVARPVIAWVVRPVIRRERPRMRDSPQHARK